ncbi:uncharacterized protein tow [Halyomorpha halys]|uniref:uncharacterized protein tow n=1 Tax=Halyomorpha halys TaxID=286706 RepID=UPI0006D4E0A7
MGCGQSHIAVIYPRKSKAKSSGSGAASEESDEEGQGGGEAATNPVAEESPPTSEHEEDARLRIQISSSPLLAQAELSSSQSDFFKMLDEKINNGPDYDPSCEYEFAMDQTQLCRFLQEWQAAKLRSRCGLTGGPKLQRYHSLQSNGEVPQRKLHHQMSTYTPAPPHPQYHYPPLQYQPHPYHQPPPNQVANLVVMYDKREGYCTKLA